MIDSWMDWYLISLRPNQAAHIQQLAVHFQGFSWSIFTYDAAYMYLTILNETISEGGDPRNGTALYNKAKNRRMPNGTVACLIEYSIHLRKLLFVNGRSPWISC